MTLDPHYFNIRKCITEVLDMLTAKKNNPDVRLSLYLDNTVPAEVYADSYRLKQVLTNLVGNSVKFTSEGEVSVNVTGTKKADDGWSLHFQVKDTGIGMESDKISGLFTPFNQLDSSIARKYGGSGLGLVISQRLVALLGGTISVESEPGKGSTFAFNIVCQTRKRHLPGVLLQEQPGQQAAKTDLTPEFALEYPYEILVAEDNLMNQKLIFKVLQKLGYTPDLADDGLKVLDMLEEKVYDLILMDIQMPNLDGLEATRRIRTSYGDRPLILAMTANALTDDRHDCLEAGANGYLAKPLNIETLIGTLKTMHKSL
jgi:CheY-like chemotaxis protein